ncbi:E3 ubiquitin-protein ligase rnf213-alpha-like [Mytilus trossulus]|uniref:E3 ubiquitin-protein ligase rnf213-alpha-like n=1 Tax=Mytilus trossulus TaxID=6551 RepID=UPI00300529C3
MAEEHVYKSDTGYTTAVRKDYTDVDYCMHVIVAPTILSDLQKDKVFVKFIGGDVSYQLKFKREFWDGFVEYEGVLRAKKGKIILYNYYVIINGSEEVKEFIYKHGDGKIEKGLWYRTMGSTDLQKKDLYHIYDGVVQGEPLDEKDKDKNVLSKWIHKGLKKVTKWIGNDEYQKMLLTDAELAMKEFTRGLLEDISTINGEELIERFSDIVQGLRKWYYMHEKLWSSVEDFNKIIAQVLKTNLISLINMIKQYPKSSNNVAGITTAVSIVYLKEQYDITFDITDLSHLCKALLPNLDTAQRLSTDLEDFYKSYPTKIREVARYLLSMVKRLLNNSKSPCWLYCIPLLHFLQEGIFPYQEVPEAINHRDVIPRWWGIDNFSSELDVYKSKSDFESPSDLVQILHPYFEMDFLLPRTFVASLSFKQFVALDTKHIPPDIMLAAFYYFVKVKKLYRDESWIYCLQEVLGKVTSQLCMLESSSLTIDVLEVFRRSYRIAADVLEECFQLKTSTREQRVKFSLCAMKTFLHSVHFFDQCLSLQKEKKKTNEHYSLLQTFEKKLVDLLLFNLFFKTKDCLMVDEFQLKSILDVFCERLYDFGYILQEILTKSALKDAENMEFPKALYFTE